MCLLVLDTLFANGLSMGPPNASSMMKLIRTVRRLAKKPSEITIVHNDRTDDEA